VSRGAELSGAPGRGRRSETIPEVADSCIRAGAAAAFEAAVARGADTVIRHGPGFPDRRPEYGIGSSERYLLLIDWDSLESHTIGIRQAERFGQWRAIVGPFFAEPPRVERSGLVMQGAG
jgi:hypothetical protein